MSLAARRRGDTLSTPDARMHGESDVHVTPRRFKDVPKDTDDYAMDNDDVDSAETPSDDQEGESTALEEEDELSEEEGPGYAQFIDPEDDSDTDPGNDTDEDDEDEEDTLRQRTSPDLHRNHIDSLFQTAQGPTYSAPR